MGQDQEETQALHEMVGSIKRVRDQRSATTVASHPLAHFRATRSAAAYQLPGSPIIPVVSIGRCNTSPKSILLSFKAKCACGCQFKETPILIRSN